MVSRSADRRDGHRPGQEAALAARADGPAVTRTEDLAAGDPRDIARALLPQFGFSADQFACLDSLWTGESGWRVDADNPTSSAYGIPQALPGSKMASPAPTGRPTRTPRSAGASATSSDRYGSPCGAWTLQVGHGWY